MQMVVPIVLRHFHKNISLFFISCYQNVFYQMLFRWKYLCLKKKIFISIRCKIANGFLGGKVRSAETCHSRKYHKCYRKKKKMREKNTRMRAADQIENTKMFCYHLKQMLIFLYYTQNNATRIPISIYHMLYIWYPFTHFYEIVV